MKIVVGTRNLLKIDAVREVLARSGRFPGVEVIGIDIDSQVGKQPMTLEQTTLGAINRAKGAFAYGDLGIGIESGLMDFPYAHTKRMNITVCAIHDGTLTHLATTSGFETPLDINAFLEQGMDLDEAVYAAGYSDDPNIGKKGGIVGILTEGRLPRKEYTKECVEMAIIHVRM